jgi:exosortase
LGLALVSAAFLVAAFAPLPFFDPEPFIDHDKLEQEFFSPSDSSPMMVMMISAWLLSRRWGRLVALPLKGGQAGVAGGMLALAAGTQMWSIWVAAGDLQAVSLMLTMLGLSYLYGGWRALRVALLPAVFLLFVMPMPAPLLNAMISKLQYSTADFAGLLLNAAGLDAFVVGETIFRGSAKFKIIETCSGIRTMETLLMLTVLMADMFRRSPLHSTLLFLLTPFISFLFNGFRAITIILNPYSEIVSIHMLQGVVMLLAGMLAVYVLDGLLERVLPSSKERESAGSLGESALVPIKARSPWLGVGALACLAAIGLLATPRAPFERLVDPELMIEFDELKDWSISELDVDVAFLGRMGARTQVHRRYQRPGETVDLYLAVGERGQRSRSVLFSKAQLLGGGWATADQGDVERVAEGAAAHWRIAKSLTESHLVVSWHENAGGLLEESARSLLGLGRSPMRRAGEALTLRISTPLAGRGEKNIAKARLLLETFATELRPVLDDLDEVLRWGTE